MKYETARLSRSIPAKLRSTRFLFASFPGFTLIELLIVISIIGILTMLSIASYNTFNRTQSYNNAVNDLVNTLQVARSRASSQYAPASLCNRPPGLTDYRVAITSTSIVLRITCFAPGTSNLRTVDVSSTTIPANATISPASVVTFTLQGTATPATFTVTGSQTKTVVVSAGGQITVNP